MKKFFSVSLLGFIFSFWVPSTLAQNSTCISKLPYRLTSEYSVPGREAPVVLPNSRAWVISLAAGAVATQAYILLSSVGTPATGSEGVWLPNGGYEEGEYSFFASYTRPLIYGAECVSQVCRKVAGLKQEREYRKSIAAITFLTYGAYQVLNRENQGAQRQGLASLYSPEWVDLGPFERRLERSEKELGLRAFQRLLEEDDETDRVLRGLTDVQWAELIVNADLAGLLCHENSPYLNARHEDKPRILFREFFKNSMRQAFSRSDVVMSQEEFLRFPFSSADYAMSLAGFSTFIREELGELPEDTLDDRFVKVKYYAYVLRQMPPQILDLIRFQAGDFFPL